MITRSPKVTSLPTLLLPLLPIRIVALFSPIMGGGNGQKPGWLVRSAWRNTNLLKGSQLESNKKAMTIQCKVCMQTFICTTSEVKCREHAEAKHPKADVYACFPHLKK